jgi:hypothetical protein
MRFPFWPVLSFSHEWNGGGGVPVQAAAALKS